MSAGVCAWTGQESKRAKGKGRRDVIWMMDPDLWECTALCGMMRNRGEGQGRGATGGEGGRSQVR